jgi:hypothetical protein
MVKSLARSSSVESVQSSFETISLCIICLILLGAGKKVEATQPEKCHMPKQQPPLAQTHNWLVVVFANSPAVH